MVLNIALPKLHVLSKLGGIKHESVGDRKVHWEVLVVTSLEILHISFGLSKSVSDR